MEKILLLKGINNNMIIIKKLEVNKPFQYLWLKYVNDTNLKVHCARCLIGKYDNRINPNITLIEDMPLNQSESKYYYLCGVSKPYNWNNNFHLAFKKKIGSILTYQNNGISIILENAERIMFDETDIDLNDENSKKYEYYSCRNWQFANKISEKKKDRQTRLL